MDRGIYGGVEGALTEHIRSELRVDRPGIVDIGELCFLRKGVAAEPVGEQQIHPRAPLGVLGGMDVQVGKGRDDQIPAVVLNGYVPEALGHNGVDPLHQSPLHGQIAVFVDEQGTVRCGEEYVAVKKLHKLTS